MRYIGHGLVHDPRVKSDAPGELVSEGDWVAENRTPHRHYHWSVSPDQPTQRKYSWVFRFNK